MPPCGAPILSPTPRGARGPQLSASATAASSSWSEYGFGKKAQPRRQKKCATRTGFDVTPIGVGEYAGFELDGDGRFLLGDFTVTHNTVCAAVIIRNAIAKGKRVLFLAHRRELIKQPFEKLVAWGIDRQGRTLANIWNDWRRPRIGEL